MYSIKLHKKVIKFINTRTQKDKQKIRQKFLQLQRNPYPSNEFIDSKKLTNSTFFRLRVANYRFLYIVNDNELVIYIEEADNRGDIY